MSYARTAKLENPAALARAQKLAESANYQVRFEGTKYVRGWPSASSKPYHLKYADGSHLASYGTLDALLKSLRGRIAA